MVIALASKPGITGASVLSIPKDWDATWFRHFINNMLKGADVRNAVGTNGVTVSGSIASPYATITIGKGPITITASTTAPALTVDGSAGSVAMVLNSANLGNQGTADFEIARAGSSANAVGQGPTIQLQDSANSTATILQNSGGQTELWQYNGGWNQVLVVSTGRNITIAGNLSVGSSASSSLSLTGQLSLVDITGSATAAAGTATLPSNPVGFIQVTIAGTARHIPYYA